MGNELLVEKFMRISNMDKDGISLIIFKQLESYYWLCENYDGDIDSVYKKLKWTSEEIEDFVMVIYSYFSFKKEDLEINEALQHFNVTTASKEDWDELKRVFLEVTLRKAELLPQ